jgi:4a-hydroxytetrahydrobiopterin dehydratase
MGTPPDWELIDGALERTFAFPNFVDALAFANRVGELAEAENHHPELTVSWGATKVRWWTHTANGVTERDEHLAERCSALA